MSSRERQIPLEGLGQTRPIEKVSRRKKRPKVLSDRRRVELSAQIWAEDIKPLIDEGREMWVAMNATLSMDKARHDVEEMPPEMDMDRIDKNLSLIVKEGRRKGLTSMDFIKPLRSDTATLVGLKSFMASQIKRHEGHVIEVIENAFQNTAEYTKRLQKAAYKNRGKVNPKVA